MYLSIVETLLEGISSLFGGILYTIIISIVGCIYSVVYYVYQIFIALANVNIFDGNIFDSITSKVYLVLGIFILFALAYNLLNLIIDPAKDKGSKQVLDMIKKIISSFIIIVITPVAFKYAILIQNAVLTQNFIGELFKTSETKTLELRYQVATLSRDYFRTFFEPEDDADETYNKSLYFKKSAKDQFGDKIEVDCSTKESCTLEEVDDYVEASGDFYIYIAFALNAYEGDISFSWLLSLIVGIYIAYVLISFCFDMATRQIKLIFYQIIAPLCIACRVIPNQEKTFKNWLSAVFKTYMSVFIRLLLLTISVFLINIITKNWSKTISADFCDKIICSTGVKTFAKIFLILACITFVKQGSKMICEIFGFDDIKLNMKGKIKDTGAFMAGSAIGSGITNASRSSAEEFKQMGKGQGWKSNLGHLAKGIGKGSIGFASGAVSGGKNGAGADSLKGMKDATVKTMNDIESKKNQIAIDKANGNTVLKKAGRWFTGGTDNVSTNSQIFQAAESIKDHAQRQIINDAGKDKKFNYGIDRMNGTFSSDGFVDGNNQAVNLGYSNKNARRMHEALINKKDGKVTFVIDESKDPNDKGNIATIDAKEFEKILTKYKEQLANSQSVYKNDKIDALNEHTIDYSTEMLHTMQTILDQAKRSGAEKVSMEGITRDKDKEIETAKLEDLVNSYQKSFSELVASITAQTPENWHKFAKENDGSDTLGALYSENLQLRQLISNNQSSEIVKELRKMHNMEDSGKFVKAISEEQLSFLEGGLLSDMKKANQNINDRIAERMYKANVINTNTQDKK